MNAPVLVTLDPTKLRDQIQSDPTLQAMIGRGYTIATSCVLVGGAEGSETQQFALVLSPPPSPSARSIPRWVAWWAVAMAAMTAAQVGLLIWSLVK